RQIPSYNIRPRVVFNLTDSGRVVSLRLEVFGQKRKPGHACSGIGAVINNPCSRRSFAAQKRCPGRIAKRELAIRSCELGAVAGQPVYVRGSSYRVSVSSERGSKIICEYQQHVWIWKQPDSLRRNCNGEQDQRDQADDSPFQWVRAD